MPLIFGGKLPEDGGNTFLRIVGAVYKPTRRHSPPPPNSKLIFTLIAVKILNPTAETLWFDITPWGVTLQVFLIGAQMKKFLFYL
jgi:hypothetical protein